MPNGSGTSTFNISLRYDNGMNPTRRLWAIGGLAAFLAAFGVLLARPVALAGAALVGGWLLSRQYRFLRAAERTADSLSVRQSPARTGVRTEASVPVTLAAAVDPDGLPADFDLSIEAGLPAAARAGDSLELTLGKSSPEADRTATVEWPVAGRHRFDAATVTATDGLFRETFAVGDRPAITVEPPGPRGVHVGEGGERVAAIGEHASHRSGSGIEPAEVREYVPGDAARRIDWKATARLAAPHVRERESESDRRTLLVVDHRKSLGVGPPSETKLDYLRAAALATAASAHHLGDPVGLVAVGDEGITDRFDPDTGPAAYRRVRSALLDLAATTPVEPDGESTRTRADADGEVTTGPDRDVGESRPSGDGEYRRSGDGEPSTAGLGSSTGDSVASRRRSVGDARRSFSALAGDADRFARALRPFYADRRPYLRRLESDPLFGAVRAELGRRTGGAWLVLFADDARPAELRETVTFARQRGCNVLVLLAPTVLYEPGGLADVERAYDRYLAFEEFRRELARMDRVRAVEVGPTDRVAAVLESGAAGGARS